MKRKAFLQTTAAVIGSSLLPTVSTAKETTKEVYPVCPFNRYTCKIRA